MKKILFTLLLGSLLFARSTFAEVDCKAGIFACQFHDPEVQSALQPAVRFTLLQDQTVHVEVDVWDSLDCSGFSDHFEGDVTRPAGDNIVHLRYNPPLLTGTTFTAKWRVGPCPPTDCEVYVMGNPYNPQGCTPSKNGNEPTISYLEPSPW